MCNKKFGEKKRKEKSAFAPESFFVAQKSQRVKFHGSKQEVMSKETVRGGRRLRTSCPDPDAALRNDLICLSLFSLSPSLCPSLICPQIF